VERPCVGRQDQRRSIQDRDELRYALFDGGRWRYVTVDATGSSFDGEATALTFDQEGLPVIAYQVVFFDPIDNTVERILRVARGVAR